MPIATSRTKRPLALNNDIPFTSESQHDKKQYTADSALDLLQPQRKNRVNSPSTTSSKPRRHVPKSASLSSLPSLDYNHRSLDDNDISDEEFLFADEQELVKGHRRRVRSCDDIHFKTIIYAGSDSCADSFFDGEEDLLDHIAPIPHSGLSEEEEWRFGPTPFTEDEDEESTTPATFEADTPFHWNVPISSQVVYFDECKSTQFSHCSEPRKTRGVYRKPVPTTSLEEISRDLMLCKVMETRPLITSLLCLTDDTPAHARYRCHNERAARTKYPSPDPDSLRRESLERRRLLKHGYTFAPQPTPLLDMNKPELFPRAGDLFQLHCSTSSAIIDDWQLGNVAFYCIQKLLFSFDLRMRTRDWLWEDEEEVFNSLGDAKEWEFDWEKRWKVAIWLLAQDTSE